MSIELKRHGLSVRGLCLENQKHYKGVINLQSQSLFRISTARAWSSLNDADIKTFSWLEAISLSSSASAPLPTPTA